MTRPVEADFGKLCLGLNQPSNTTLTCWQILGSMLTFLRVVFCRCIRNSFSDGWSPAQIILWLEVHSECAGVTRFLNELQAMPPLFSIGGTRFAIYVDNGRSQ
jgi:uncharacterized SAM-binding protein YcdF (DUF218 family)